MTYPESVGCRETHPRPSEPGRVQGVNTGNRNARGRASKLPSSCLSAITKMAAVVPTDVSTDKPQANSLELIQWEQAEEDKGESAGCSEKQLSDVD